MLSEELQLALIFIKDNFGTYTHDVCKVLLLRDKLHLHEIQMATHFHISLVQNCLITLIHFNIVYFVEDDSSKYLKNRINDNNGIDSKSSQACQKNPDLINNEHSKYSFLCNNKNDGIVSNEDLNISNMVGKSSEITMENPDIPCSRGDEKKKNTKNKTDSTRQIKQFPLTSIKNPINIENNPTLQHKPKNSNINPVNNTQKTPKPKTNVDVKYSINLKNILLRFRYAHFVSIIEENYGFVERVIIIQLLKYHKLSYESIIKAVLTDPYNSIEELKCTSSKRKTGTKFTVENIKKAFRTLARNNIVLRCQSPFLDRKTIISDGMIKKSAKLGDVLSDDRFGKNLVVETKKKRAKESDTLKSNKSQKILEGVNEIAVTVDKEEGIYAPNLTVLNFLFFKKICMDFLKNRFSGNLIAKEVTNIFLQSSTLVSEQQITMRELSYNEIEKMIESNCKKSGETINKNNILRLLQFMVKHPDNIFKEKMINETVYFFLDWDNLIKILRRRIVYNVVSSRCGSYCGRIWSFLASSSENHQLVDQSNKRTCYDEQTISENVLLDHREIRKALFSLVVNQFARAYEADCLMNWNTMINTSSLTSRHSLLFNVDLVQNYAEICRNIHKVCLNLYERQTAENLKICQLYCKNVSSTLSSKDEDLLRNREAAEDVLEAKFVHLQSSLAILNDNYYSY